MRPRTFIFFSRLEPEKGIDMLIDIVHKLERVGFWKQHRLLICGQGSREKSLKASLIPVGLQDISPATNHSIPSSGIFFLGWRHPESMIDILGQCDIHIMPSCFLETFGLSALEMGYLGVPTIAFSQGGLSQLLLPELSILPESNSDAFVKLMGDIVLRDDEYFLNLKNCIGNIVAHYNPHEFLRVFDTHFPYASNILFISDYAEVIGGLEKTTHTFMHTLDYKGKNVGLLGSKKSTFFHRCMNVIVSVVNIFGILKISKEIQRFNPDLIWIQSMQRVWGFLGVRAILQKRIPTVAMHHDFGIISPFAQDIKTLDDIPQRWRFIDFYHSLRRPTLLRKFFLVYKFILLSLYRAQIKKIPLHFVPSKFMIEPFSRLLGIPPDCFRVVPLYIEKT